jgi:alpha-amylase/alpha-mannosidase (GH57 family)
VFHTNVFGLEAAGCWPSEGAVSGDALALLARAGFTWAASGEGVLHNSLGRNPRESGTIQDLYHPWVVGTETESIACFFRDDKLSDLIGFEYQHWHTDDAIANFMHELEGIRHHTQGMEAPVVSVILDGENAWEYYPENGLPFLRGLYQAIAEHPEYELTTFSDYLGRHPHQARLPSVCAGSWVYGNLATWIGEPAKNRAWEMLIEAKEHLDRKLAENALEPGTIEAAMEQLRICEGSDWFWWFGDYNPAEAVQDFDRLYRQHLTKLYELIGEPAPSYLKHPISTGGGEAEASGTMRRGSTEA